MSQSRYNDKNFPRDADAWSEAYRVYLPVFYGVLGRMAKQGYVRRNSQGLEIIHDFFTEAWPTLADRFDPEQGTMGAYVTGAFARFARRRLVREAYWFRNLTADHEDSTRTIAGYSAASHHGVGYDDATSSIDPIDRARLRRAVAALSDEDRQLLSERYGSQAQSERELARQHGWTRYRVRDRLARALLRVSCEFGHSGILSADELALARELFCEGRSVREVATTFKLTEPQVRLMRTRILNAIGEAVGGSSMTEENMAALLRRFLGCATKVRG